MIWAIAIIVFLLFIRWCNIKSTKMDMAIVDQSVKMIAYWITKDDNYRNEHDIMWKKFKFSDKERSKILKTRCLTFLTDRVTKELENHNHSKPEKLDELVEKSVNYLIKADPRHGFTK